MTPVTIDNEVRPRRGRIGCWGRNRDRGEACLLDSSPPATGMSEFSSSLGAIAKPLGCRASPTLNGSFVFVEAG